MSETSIQWTDYTFNPWWGCVRVSPGCENCYAETFAHRLGLDVWGPQSPRRFFDDKHWSEPFLWHRRRMGGDRRHRVFCASMADIFEDRRDLDVWREGLWALIEGTPKLTWQLLTKRPENVLAMVPKWWRTGFPPNVWMLTTAEDQERLDVRGPILQSIPVMVRGISYEPALGPIDLSPFMAAFPPTPGYYVAHTITWAIAGGESGHGARPMSLEWARAVREQCRRSGAAFFYKQGGASNRCEHDKKGGHFECFPDDLKVREFPA